MRDLLENYPQSGYVIKEMAGGELTVTCPLHGDFRVSETNFKYLRGCSACRGVHPRFRPVGCNRPNTGHVVYIRETLCGGLVASPLDGVFVYAVGYKDRRVADVVLRVANDMIESEDTSMLKLFLDRSAEFTPIPGKYIKKSLFEFLGVPPVRWKRGRSVDVQAVAEARYPEGGYIVDQSDFKGADSDIKVICPDHGPFYVKWRVFTRLKGCPQCNGHHHRAHPVGPSRRNVVFLLKLCEGYYSIGGDRDNLCRAVTAVIFNNAHEARLVREQIAALCSAPGVLNQVEFEAANLLLETLAPKPIQPEEGLIK